MEIVTFIAAASGSGKTTLIEKLIPLLKAKGLRVAVVKHAPEGFEIDRPGKDSWRFREAGADSVLLVGPEGIALQARAELFPGQVDMMPLIGRVDIVLREGFKQEGGPRIEVFRSGISGDAPLCATDRSIEALVSDERIETGISWYHIDDAEGIAEFIAAKL